jgi:hypothetical protein
MISITGNEIEINARFTNNELAKYLGQFQEKDRIEQLVKLIESALVVRSAFLLDLETTTIANSVKQSKIALEEHFELIRAEIQKAMKELTDPENGEFNKTFGTVVEKELDSLLDSQKEGTKMQLLKQSIFQEIEGLESKVTTIQSKLGILVTNTKNPDDGNLFENVVGSYFAEFAQLYQDTFSRTGFNPAPGIGAKKGDLLIALNDDEIANSNENAIAIEVKTADDFKRIGSPSSSRTAHEVKIIKELSKAMQTRNAVVGVFVLDSSHLNMQIQPKWQLLSNNQLLIILDPVNPEPHYIQLAYAWARWFISKGNKNVTTDAAIDPHKIEVDSVDRNIKEILNLVKSTKSVSDSFGKLLTAVGAAQMAVQNHRQEIENRIHLFLSEIATR